MIHRYSQIFTDIHRYSQIFADIHRYSHDLVILLHWWFWWVQNCPSCQEIPFGVSDRSVHAGGRFRYSLLLVHTCIYTCTWKEVKAQIVKKLGQFLAQLCPFNRSATKSCPGSNLHPAMLPLRAFFTRSLLLTPHTFWDRTEESKDCRSIQWLSMAIHGYPIWWRPRRSIDWGSTGRWSWPWTFLFFSGCFWHRIPLESQTDIPSRSKACWDGEGARAELTKLCRNFNGVLEGLFSGHKSF